jgi:hypothetical protein
VSDETAPSVHGRPQAGNRPNPTGLIQVPDEPWVDDALCAQTDPEAFFPEKGGSTADAKRICGLCSAREECLRYALDHDERFGIWGGHSERERRAMKRSA